MLINIHIAEINIRNQSDWDIIFTKKENCVKENVCYPVLQD